MPTLLTVQAFSLYGPGGGPRILRSLLEGGPWRTISVVAGPLPPSHAGAIPEYHLSTRPTFGRLERTRIHRTLHSLELAYVRSLSARLDEMVGLHSVSAIHSVAHGLDFVAAHHVAASRRLPLLLTIHDHPVYAFSGWPTRELALRFLRAPWQEAAHRYVISPELGEDMARRYGSGRYSVVTDGIRAVPEPKCRSDHDRRVYFMGAFHISYRDNLLALLKGLALYRERHSAPVSMVLRGGGPKLGELEMAGVPVTVLPWGSQEDIEHDLEVADLIYFPLPFGLAHEYFVRFSLSTKLVTFLASGLPILFHGPGESAAAHLLSNTEAAICVDSLDANAVADAIAYHPAQARGVSTAAATLAQDRFHLEDQRERFWRPLLTLTSADV
jgi:hypothetical protein